MRVFGLWHGGSSYSYGYLKSDCETWKSRSDAEESLRLRRNNGYWYRDSLANRVDFDEDGIATIGVESGDLTPTVDETTHIDIYPATRVGRKKWRIGNEPIYRLSLGPRGGIKRENF